MKRHGELLALSREHHAALKLVRASRRVAAAGDAAAVEHQARQVATVFAVELEPHFHAEEAGLLRWLAAAGQGLLVERTLADHRELRALAAELRQPATATLARFADLLEAHVRFEERELFETAQALMPERTAEAPADDD